MAVCPRLRHVSVALRPSQWQHRCLCSSSHSAQTQNPGTGKPKPRPRLKPVSKPRPTHNAKPGKPKAKSTKHVHCVFPLSAREPMEGRSLPIFRGSEAEARRLLQHTLDHAERHRVVSDANSMSKARSLSWSLQGYPVPQVAMYGRSNVGKSTLINVLLKRIKTPLAKTSKTPGRTQHINFFRIGTGARTFEMVDIPGIGFAKVPGNVSAKMNLLLGAYVRECAADAGQGARHNLEMPLKRVFLLLDARRGLQRVDVEFISFLEELCCPYQLVLTKADKVSPLELREVLRTMSYALTNEPNDSVHRSGGTYEAEKEREQAVVAMLSPEEGKTASDSEHDRPQSLSDQDRGVSAAAEPSSSHQPRLGLCCVPWIHVVSSAERFGIEALRLSIADCVLDAMLTASKGQDSKGKAAHVERQITGPLSTG